MANLFHDPFDGGVSTTCYLCHAATPMTVAACQGYHLHPTVKGMFVA